MGDRPFVVYVDMIGDLFHAGHVSFLTKARALASERAAGREVHLIVGLMSDEDAAAYKRTPVLLLGEREQVVAACRHVDEVLAPCPPSLTDELMDERGIDLVVHGDDFDQDALERYYGPALRRGRFATVPYSAGPDRPISTTGIIDRMRPAAGSAG